MPGLVLEGGTFRPVFSCGVMDALLDHDIMFDYVVGVSAGITYAISYLSRQRGRNLEVLRRYRGDSRYFGVRNLPHDHSIFGTDFVFDTIPNQLIPFDWESRISRRREARPHLHHAARDLRHSALLPGGAAERRHIL